MGEVNERKFPNNRSKSLTKISQGFELQLEIMKSKLKYTKSQFTNVNPNSRI